MSTATVSTVYEAITVEKPYTKATDHPEVNKKKQSLPAVIQEQGSATNQEILHGEVLSDSVKELTILPQTIKIS